MWGSTHWTILLLSIIFNSILNIQVFLRNFLKTSLKVCYNPPDHFVNQGEKFCRRLSLKLWLNFKFYLDISLFNKTYLLRTFMERYSILWFWCLLFYSFQNVIYKFLFFSQIINNSKNNLTPLRFTFEVEVFSRGKFYRNMLMFEILD